ncbi:putative beta-lysine N-acetyltransferase [Bacillus sp. FJAT-45037]|uniref:putative beta-lysine N-acetyltransferase n=1 Tax=Bacillus sp. FJAT-45037 TaxID=2011007 RepID=UPI000C24E454|nr:putative beta-lysine N-acetyltransferase [Bacillus sp. FJAT-45037]
MASTTIFKQPTFIMELTTDEFNKRLRVESFRGSVPDLVHFLEETATKGPYEKIIVQAHQDAWEEFLCYGFQMEGRIAGLFNGGCGYVLTMYYSDERRTSRLWQKEQKILIDVQRKTRKPIKQDVPIHYQMRKASSEDAPALAALYKNVFNVYPTPMNDPNYVKKILDGNSIFCVTEYEGEIVSAASADIHSTYHHAELTDCATLEDHRAHGLMKHLLMKLEEELISRHIFCAFSLARAKSFGINDAFFQLGYSYGGRLTNNCYIFEDLEDMNIWCKDLSVSAPLLVKTSC